MSGETKTPDAFFADRPFSRTLYEAVREVVEPYPGRFTHHLELYETADVDAEVVQWLRQAWEEAVN
jgi:hypothetical protein